MVSVPPRLVGTADRVTNAVVVGAAGQLGSALIAHLDDPVAMTRRDLDITDRATVRTVLGGLRPQTVYNAAAYTDVDGTEADPDGAYAVNSDGVRWLAEACDDIGAKLVTFSTDYVFDGTAERYVESDQTDPINIYGASKLAGERAAFESGGDVLIIRTSWLISTTHPNFVSTMLRLADSGGARVVDDQSGRATVARDLARAAIAAAPVASGLLHLSNPGVLSWFELARRAVELAGMDPELIRPCTTEEFPRPAKRPRRSVLESERLGPLGLEPLPHIDDSLPALVDAQVRSSRK